MKLLINGLILACSAYAGEFAILSNGSLIHAESHETEGTNIRLKSQTGSIDIPADSVLRFEGDSLFNLPEPPAVKVVSAQSNVPVQSAALSPPPAISILPPIARAIPTLEMTHAMIKAAARKHKVPAAFVKSIVAAESNFDCQAVSRVGAVGLMQLMPATAQQMGADPMIAEQNIDAGTRYLRTLMDRYRRSRDWMRRVIAAYNAGPAMVDRYRGVPPFPETRAYVARVLAYLRIFSRES
jgi:hypothetical protein